MGKILTIVLLLIVAVLGLGFGWVSYQEKEKLEAREADQASRLAELEAETNRLGQETSEAIAARERETSRAAQAEEAARMAKELAAKAAAEKEAQLAQLNSRLEAAARERKEAESQAKVLADRMAALELARKEATERLAALGQARVGTGTGITPGEAEDAEASELAAKLAEQETQLEQLREENLALHERTQQLIAKQIEAEEAIVAAGGEFRAPNIEVMSPSAKRYMAQRHRARLAEEHPAP